MRAFRETRAVSILDIEQAGERHEAFAVAGEPYVVEVSRRDKAALEFAHLEAWLRDWREECWVSPSGAFLYLNDARLDPHRAPSERSQPEGRYHSFVLPLPEIIDRITNPGARAPLVAAGEVVYWYCGRVHAELRAQLGSLPAPMDGCEDQGAWLSQAGAITTLHYDQTPGFLVQLQGRKRVVLAPITADLYPFPVTDWRTRSSQVIDLPGVDLEQYPNFARSHCWEVELEPGQVLFVPNPIWHWVESLEASLSLTLKQRAPALAATWRSIEYAFGDEAYLRQLSAPQRAAVLAIFERDYLGSLR
ncbi:hypothetical protein DB30_04620 [Enhygromyxa salina]|uniref:JmjC domain-containing protein n=1 Tax=Enhygromyxa salina TaxID=215803 RepID=A0A0C2DCJ7_9BACT|nr:cupin-like domain-containing protein [Enhygromyxa salina]KIG19155.1 hypothetical protein DB30_04620 [Enhygromyxa salina]